MMEAAAGSGHEPEGRSGAAHLHRRLDEQVTLCVESFLTDRLADGKPFSAGDFARAISAPRFDEREAQLFLVALKSQGRAHYDWRGWHAGQGTV